MNLPEKPTVIWRDLQTRIVQDEMVDTEKKNLRIRLRGVPDSKSTILVWNGKKVVSLDVNYPESGLTEVGVGID